MPASLASQTIYIDSGIWKLSVLTRHMEMCLFWIEMDFSVCIVPYDQNCFGGRLNVQPGFMFLAQTVMQRKSFIQKAPCIFQTQSNVFVSKDVWVNVQNFFSSLFFVKKEQNTERKTSSSLAKANWDKERDSSVVCPDGTTMSPI